MPGPTSTDVVMADAPPMPKDQTTAVIGVIPPSMARSDLVVTAAKESSPATGSVRTKLPAIAPPNDSRSNDQTTAPRQKAFRPLSPSKMASGSEPAPEPWRPNPEMHRIKTEKQRRDLIEALDQTTPLIAREIFRKRWRTMLFDGTDNDDHASFILRAGLKNATPHVIQRILREEGIYKEEFVSTLCKKPVFIETILRQASSEQITTFASTRELDRVLARRLTTLPARDLIRWLAEADRLGYKADDILEDDETVRPNISKEADSPGLVLHHPLAPPGYVTPLSDVSTPKDALLLEQERNLRIQRQQQEQQQQQISMQAAKLQKKRKDEDLRNGHEPSADPSLVCPLCKYEFTSRSGYNYHTSKKVCQKTAPREGYKNFCMLCGQGFTTKQGMQYHQMKKVCEDADASSGTPTKTAPPPDPKSATPSSAVAQPATGRPAPISTPTLPPPTHAPAFPLNGHSPSDLDAPAHPSSQRTHKSVSRPQMQTPSTTSVPSIDTPLPAGVRVSPQLLSEAQRQKLNEELDAADARYAQSLAALPRDWSAEKKSVRMISLKNSVSARKSQIRKNYGVSLRLRDKDKAAIRKASEGTIPPNQRKAGEDDRFQEYIAPPTSSFSPINAQSPRHQPPPRPRVNTAALSSHLHDNSPSQSPLSSSYTNGHPAPSSSNPHASKRRRSRTPPTSSYYSANPPRRSSPFVTQNETQAGSASSAGSAPDPTQQLRSQDAIGFSKFKSSNFDTGGRGRVITVDSSSDGTEDEGTRSNSLPRRETGGRVDVGPARVDFRQTSTSKNEVGGAGKAQREPHAPASKASASRSSDETQDEDERRKDGVHISKGTHSTVIAGPRRSEGAGPTT